MNETLRTRPDLPDQLFLIHLIEYAIIELEDQRRRLPTKKEILDHLFSAARDDHEAQQLEKRLDRLLDRLLGERP
ncbi:MAG: hypothetical protein ACXWQO_02545 [Bdellovibrionota bacterium]